ncbi:hypothetical protein [Methylobacterium sp. B4]|uniref:hypothetical protein n=1 Tax=Methylobacterium sp. B4 TaxID=1938755 RepID=UPI000D834FEB|nr:hypothetical protein [Methylobacterium sp. B4]PXW53727.1 hypothetical protein BY998_12334 [Methylobacterium sp. B4]
MKYLNNADLDGSIVFITHRTFLGLPFFYRKDRWSLYFDECPNVLETFSENLSIKHGLITDHVRTRDSASAYSRLQVTNQSELTKTAENRGQDSIVEHIQDLAKILLSKNYDNYVNIAKFESLRAKTSSDGILSVFSILKPSIFLDFDSVTISGALFEETFAFHQWSQTGVIWKKSLELTRENAANLHPFNPSVTIHYGYETRYSKYLRDKLGGDNTPIIQAATKKLGNQKYVRVENNDVKLTSPLNKLLGDNLIPGISHGLNQYRHVHHAAVIIANNQTPEASKFLKEYCGFDDDKQFRAFTDHSVYQAICRTSIRDNDLAHDKTWIVASKDTADWLHRIFPGSRAESLGLDQPEKQKVGRKRTYDSDNERKNASKKRSRAELSLASGFAHNIDSSYLERVSYLNDDESAIKDISRFVARFRGSYFNNYLSTDPFVISKTEDQFIRYLKDHSKNVYTSKNEIPCVSGALFDVDKSDDTDRGNDNVELVRGMWIDIEKGTMTHNDFSRAFPQLRMVAYNTFRHTLERMRCRIYIPTNRVMKDTEYRMIHKEIVYVLETKGYRSGKLADDICRESLQGNYHGIDSLPHPCAVFALPCQAQERQASFFKEYKGDRRAPLDVDSWIQHRIAPDDVGMVDSLSYVPLDEDALTISPDQQAGIDTSMSEWYRIGSLPGEGHDAIFTLYHALCALKLHPQTISERLYEAAQSAYSPVHRNKQVDRLMKNLLRWHQSRR